MISQNLIYGFKQLIRKTDMYPGVDGELQVLGARDHGGNLEAGVGVGDDVHDGRVGLELEHHQQVLHRPVRKHHWRLGKKNTAKFN